MSSTLHPGSQRYERIEHGYSRLRLPLRDQRHGHLRALQEHDAGLRLLVNLPSPSGRA